ncbi:hypothetical protein U9M48_037320 [Paspalum notatum var. saurae]|uniref:Uncharacterized protein n=1 Tax=Paspalum notatum var. saurae TaxID=547442 RepID=A0AAQ3XAY2_PASNO
MVAAGLATGRTPLRLEASAPSMAAGSREEVALLAMALLGQPTSREEGECGSTDVSCVKIKEDSEPGDFCFD